MQVAVTLITTGSATITVTGGPGNIRDYVGLYLPGAASYFDWRYVANGTKTRAPAGSTNGIVKFLNLKVGAYEAKLFSLTNAGVATLIEAMPFSVGGSVIIGSSKDIVGPDSSAVVGPDNSAVVGP